MFPTLLSIAASDSIGGAGIQADIRTASAFGVYPATALTAVTAQNSCGVHDSMPMPGAILERQLECILSDFMPDAVKIGLLPTVESVETVTTFLHRHSLRNIVLDPVLRPTAGSRFSEDGVADAIAGLLLPLVTLATPNLEEYETLRSLAPDIMRTHAILLKGGHIRQGQNAATACDVLTLPGGKSAEEEIRMEFASPRIDTPNTHGTGCVLSSAIASLLAIGQELPEAVGSAKRWMQKCLSLGKDIQFGRCGYGPALSMIPPADTGQNK